MTRTGSRYVAKEHGGSLWKCEDKGHGEEHLSWEISHKTISNSKLRGNIVKDWMPNNVSLGYKKLYLCHIEVACLNSKSAMNNILQAVGSSTRRRDMVRAPIKASIFTKPTKR